MAKRSFKNPSLLGLQIYPADLKINRKIILKKTLSDRINLLAVSSARRSWSWGKKGIWERCSKRQEQVGGSPAAPGYWEPVQGILHSRKGLSPSLPWDKAEVLLEFRETKPSGISFFLCSEGLRDCSRTPQPLLVPAVTTKSHKKKRELWLWDCSRSGMLELTRSTASPARQAGAAPSQKISFPSKTFQKTPTNAALPNSSSSLSKYLLKNPTVSVWRSC